MNHVGSVTDGFLLADVICLLADGGLLDAVLLPASAGIGMQTVAPRAAAAVVTAHMRGAGLDSRTLQAGELFLALPGERVHGRRFAPGVLAAGGWVLTDQAPDTDPLLAAVGGPHCGVLVSPNPLRALATLAAAWRARQSARIVGVTGTNGKTTTKDFLAAMLSGAGATHATKGNYNNHWGLPLTLLGLTPEYHFAVVEMGASAVGEIDGLAGLARPDVGLITNASAAHLAEFGSLENVIVAKGELLDHLSVGGTAVLNADSPGYEAWAERAPCSVVSLGAETGNHHWSYRGQELHLDGETWPVPLPGAHNALNLALAVLAGRACGVEAAELRAGLVHFAGSPHRGVVRVWGGRIVLDDAYNANPESMVAATVCAVALASGGRTFAVLGHMAEMGPDSATIHRETGQRVATAGADVLLAVGEAAAPLATGFDVVKAGGHCCASVYEAAEWLSDRVRPGDRVLVKGSRSAAMEEIFSLLELAWGESDQRLD